MWWIQALLLFGASSILGGCEFASNVTRIIVKGPGSNAAASAPKPQIFALATQQAMAPYTLHVDGVYARDSSDFEIKTKWDECNDERRYPVPDPRPNPIVLDVTSDPNYAASVDYVAKITRKVDCVEAVDFLAEAKNIDIVGAGTPLTAHYGWDFGDEQGKYNHLTGFNAAHTYELPGIYTVKLTITNEAGLSTAVSQQITVATDTRRQIFVSNDGDDANLGTRAQPIRSIARLATLLSTYKSDLRVQFRRGQTFIDTTDKFTPSNSVFTDYAEAGESALPRPVIYRDFARPGSSAFLSGGNQPQNVIIENLTFDSSDVPVVNSDGSYSAGRLPYHAMFLGGTNHTLRNCQVLNIDTLAMGFFANRGLLVSDNIAPLPHGMRGYLVWLDGQNNVVLGNRVFNSAREHVVRTSSKNTIKSLIAFNDFSNLNHTKEREGYKPGDEFDQGDQEKAVVELRVSQYSYVAQNDLRNSNAKTGGDWGWTEAGGGGTPDQLEFYIVYERNNFYDTALNVDGSTHHAMIRNNFFYRHDLNAMINVLGTATGLVRGFVRDIRIYNNTGINESTSGSFLNVGKEPHNDAVALANNVFYAPHHEIGLSKGFFSDAPVEVFASSLRGFSQIANNIWPLPQRASNYNEGVNYLGVSHLEKNSYVPADLRSANARVSGDQFANVELNNDGEISESATTTSTAAGVPGVFDDFYGRPRAGPSRIGAVGISQR